MRRVAANIVGLVGALGALGALGAPGRADASPAAGASPIRPGDGVRTTVAVAPEPVAAAPTAVLYLNRCVGGCVVHRGTGGASGDASNILPPGAGDTVTVSAFGYSDVDWAALVTCVREVFSPYAIQITDARPTAGQYNMAIVAGAPGELGFDGRTLGVAPLARDCSPLGNAISFSFANAHAAQALVANLCWTVAQEAAHAYGLDHEYQFLDGRSACSDPMTYRVDCLASGQKFFRNASATCGTEAAQPGCGPEVSGFSCAPSQNSHQLLTSLFGAGTPLTAPPTVTIAVPAAGAPVDTRVPVHAEASSQRGVTKVEVLFNGYPWASLRGLPFGGSRQPGGDYAFAFPAGLPDGVIDLQVRARDDLGLSTTTPAITFTKGAPCVDAAACLTGQRCAGGRCLWDAPAGALGDACAYDQYCQSGACVSVGGALTCVQPCALEAIGTVPGEDGTCPTGFACAASSAATTAGSPGVCLVDGGGGDGGGCCEVGGGGRGGVAGHGALAALLIAWLRRRGKRDESC